MSWLLSVNDVRPVQAVFGDLSAISPLVDLFEVKVDRDGPVLQLRFDLQDFPDDPPPKWRAAKANTVQVVLSLSGLTALTMSGVATTMLGNVHVERDTTRPWVAVRFDSDEVHLYAEAEYSSISGMSAHWKADPEERPP